MLRLARRCERTLAAGGYPVAGARPLLARPKADSAHLGREQRAAAAVDAFGLRPGWDRRLAVLRSVADAGAVVLLDDVLTTGATLAAVAARLAGAGVPVAFAATVAVTRLRHPAASHEPVPEEGTKVSGSRDGGDGVARKS
jgi:predicted amidophosphoribosyltransferase